MTHSPGSAVSSIHHSRSEVTAAAPPGRFGVRRLDGAVQCHPRPQSRVTAARAFLILLACLAATVFLAGCKKSSRPATDAKAPAPGAKAAAYPDSARSATAQMPVVAAPASGLVIVQAESFTKREAPMVVATDTDKQADDAKVTFVWCPEGPQCKDISNGKGYVVVKVDIPETKKYWFWARVWSHCTCGNECLFELRKGAVTIDALKFKMLQPTTEVWQWLRKPGTDKSAAIELQAGTYHLYIKNYEDGMRIDKILFADLPPSEFVPVGPNPEE